MKKHFCNFNLYVFYFAPLPQMTYYLTRQLCAQFQVDNLLEPDPKTGRELKIYDIIYAEYSKLHKLAVQKKVAFKVTPSFIFCLF